MKTMRVGGSTVVAMLLAGLGGAAFAQADDIAARQAFMNQVSAKMGAIRNYAGDPAAAKAAAVDLESGFKAFPGHFPVGSDAAAGKTRAKDKIWTDPAGWKAANDRVTAAASLLVLAVNSGDAEQITAATGGVQGTCGSCHGGFRGPPVP